MTAEGTGLALRHLLDAAAEKGARRALAELGLHDQDAADDLRELRALLEAWRDAKRTVRRTVVRWVTTAILVGIAVWAGVRFKVFSS